MGRKLRFFVRVVYVCSYRVIYVVLKKKKKKYFLFIYYFKIENIKIDCSIIFV